MNQRLYSSNFFKSLNKAELTLSYPNKQKSYFDFECLNSLKIKKMINKYCYKKSIKFYQNTYFELVNTQNKEIQYHHLQYLTKRNSSSLVSLFFINILSYKKMGNQICNNCPSFQNDIHENIQPQEHDQVAEVIPQKESLNLEQNFNIPKDQFQFEISNFQSNYKGQIQKNLPHGKGIMKWTNQSYYEGDWREGKACGKGKFVFPDQSVYVGSFLDNCANGFGTFTIKNCIYQGQWKNDKPNGLGKETWKDKSQYQGQYLQGKKDGLGKYVWPDGSYYEGEWSHNKMEGKGKFHWADGRQYQGDWKNSMIFGKGKYSWPDGRYYQGEYSLNLKNGKGVYHWKDGRSFQGEWDKGKRSGLGKLILKNGHFRYGIWVNDKRIKWLSASQLQKRNLIQNRGTQFQQTHLE